MKRFILLFVFLIFEILSANASESAVNASKYTVIRTNNNYTPLREDADMDAKRFSHLKKGVELYSDESLDDFYRLDLGLSKPYWIEKKYAEVKTTASNKEISEVKNILFSENDKYYLAKILTDTISPYNEIETSDKSVDFILYDAKIDETLLLKENPLFKVSKDKFNNLKISFKSNYDLSGHDVQIVRGGIIFKVKKPFRTNKNYPLKHLTIVIDPGHGGKETGACANGLTEKDINLQISKILKNALEKEGAKVYMTRHEDIDVDLYKRVDFAKKMKADFLFSIHQNSLPDRSKYLEKHGVGVYYYNRESFKIARDIQGALIQGTGFRDDGINLRSFALVRSFNPICVLIECGYIIHPEEAKKISDPDFQEIIAKSITKGIIKYLSASAVNDI